MGRRLFSRGGRMKIMNMAVEKQLENAEQPV